MRIDIYSDTVCPWCYLGMRRFELALAERPQYVPQVTWRPFELNPDLAWDGVDRAAYLAGKMGGAGQLAAMENGLVEHGRAVGLEFRFDLMERVPNSRRSHLLIAHAGRRGLQARMKERIMRAYFQEGCDIGEVGELVRLAAEAGLSADQARSALILREGQDGVVAAERHAAVLGITGVPTFVFDGQYTISGAQEPSVLARIFDQVGEFAAARALGGDARGAAPAVNREELTGRARSHVTDVGGLGCTVHGQAGTALQNLRAAAAGAGFDLKPVSGFRDFARQLAIWNAKYAGDKPVLDAYGRALDVTVMDAPGRVAALLLWSALPGASRHHWGTDVDVIDGNAVPPGYRVQLTADEFAAGGPFARVHDWLEIHAARYGFFRPYRGVISGVQAEPWHWSFAPVSEQARGALTVAVLREAIEGAPLLGKEYVLETLEDLHRRYVASIDLP